MRSDAVITLKEICDLTGLSDKRVWSMLRNAGLARIGRNWLKDEVSAYLKCRAEVQILPRTSFHDSSEKWRYINRKWKDYL